MSWLDPGARGRKALLAAALVVGAGLLAACTAGPLYGTGGIAPIEGQGGSSASIRGLVAIPVPDDRTTQLVRNALLTRLSGGEAPAGAPYELRLVAIGRQGAAVIEPASGLPVASLYSLDVTYQLVRRSTGVVVAQGKRSAQSPYDQSAQLFAAERAVVNARGEAASAVALRIELAVASAIRAEESGL